MFVSVVHVTIDIIMVLLKQQSAVKNKRFIITTYIFQFKKKCVVVPLLKISNILIPLYFL